VSTQRSDQFYLARAMLDHGNQYKVVLIIAPLGAGKMRLVQQWVLLWVEQSAPSPLWICIDNETTDLIDFLNVLFFELIKWDQNFETLFEGQVASLIEKPGFHPTDPGTILDIQPGLENLLNQMLNQLMQFPEDRYIIILNYHNFRDPRIHPVISFLIDHLPPKIHLIISSQELPALQIPRLRARRELLEIGLDDLEYEPK